MQDSKTSRRGFLLGALSAPVALNMVACARAADAPKAATVVIENFSAAGVSLGKATVARVVKTDEEWRKQLSDESYVVTRRSGTERAFTGQYNANHADGIYHCICCDTPLFDSKHKFESGTGWPSFWKPISNSNVLEEESGSQMFGTPVSCKRCEAHEGHVFDDGPDPTGLRYCINSVALSFKPRA